MAITANKPTAGGNRTARPAMSGMTTLLSSCWITMTSARAHTASSQPSPKATIRTASDNRSNDWDKFGEPKDQTEGQWRRYAQEPRPDGYENPDNGHCSHLRAEPKTQSRSTIVQGGTNSAMPFDWE